MAPHRTAILFFSFTPGREAAVKRWCGGNMHRNHFIAKNLINKTLITLRNSGLPVYHFHEDRQRGASFAERFSNAYRDLFDLGYDAVIALGNDCPDLSGLSWTDMCEVLIEEGTVIGPSRRGGVYLLGITRQQFQAGFLENIPWKTGRVYQALRGRVKNCLVLRNRRDLNTGTDILMFIRESGRRTWLGIIFQIIHRTGRSESAIRTEGKGLFWQLRAPPEVRMYLP